MLNSKVADLQRAVLLRQVTQELGTAFVAFMHNVCARLKNHWREELWIGLAKIPDSMGAPVWPDSWGVYECAWDYHAGVSHGWDVPGHPNIPLSMYVCKKKNKWVEKIDT